MRDFLRTIKTGLMSFVIGFVCFVGGAALAFTVTTSTAPNSKVPKQKSDKIECDKNFLDRDVYYQCVQAQSARELADAVLRIEKKLPNFNEF